MKKTLTVLEQVAVDVEVSENPFNFELQDLFLVAARNNSKRAFLFVSKLLGKHIPVNPKKAILTGRLLGFLINEKIKLGGRGYNISLLAQALKYDRYIDSALDYAKENLITLHEPTLFIGFAETATALGNSVFSQFYGEDIFYIHTTRDDLIECTSVFNFEEEHSHATSHFCYPLKGELLKNYKRIVLVDDEITTGKTALNLIKAINNKYPGKEYIVVSILDWRRNKHIEEYKSLEKELGVKIHEVCLLDGEATCNSPSIKDIEIQYQNNEGDLYNKNVYEEYYENGNLYKADCKYKGQEKSDNQVLVKNHLIHWQQYRNFTRNLSDGKLKDYNYLNFSGRFGLTPEEMNCIERYVDNTIDILGTFHSETLVLGTEEFMYIPMLIASKIPGAMYQSTTRSPIYTSHGDEYGVQCAAIFRNPFDKGVTNYVYNIKKGTYKEVLFITEREVDKESKDELIRLFTALNIGKINFVCFLRN